MRASIIIPTYNEEKDILECLQSLTKQKLSDFEVIVVDDGSIDLTLKKVQEFSTKKYYLSILSQDHQGPATARNKGAQKARGDILVFVDADMVFDKAFLKNLIAPIVSGKTVGTFSRDEFVRNWSNRWARCWNYNQNISSRRRLSENYPLQQKVFRAIKKSSFLKAGGFEKGGYTDDWSLSEKLGVLAVSAKKARFYHKNPDTLLEVAKQARWSAKRAYKFSYLGVLFAILRQSLPISFVVGIFKSVVYKTPSFLIFKIVFDFFSILGIFEFYILKKGAK